MKPHFNIPDFFHFSVSSFLNFLSFAIGLRLAHITADLGQLLHSIEFRSG